MFDDIGLGQAIVSLISLALLCLTLTGCIFFIYFKKKLAAALWLSIGLNLLSVFYFMGTGELILQVINIIIWPLINILLLIKFIIISIKTKQF